MYMETGAAGGSKIFLMGYNGGWQGFPRDYHARSRWQGRRRQRAATRRLRSKEARHSRCKRRRRPATAGGTREKFFLAERERLARMTECEARYRLKLRIREEILVARRHKQKAGSGDATQSELKQISMAHLAHRGRPPDRQQNDSA